MDGNADYKDLFEDLLEKAVKIARGAEDGIASYANMDKFIILKMALQYKPELLTETEQKNVRMMYNAIGD